MISAAMQQSNSRPEVFAVTARSSEPSCCGGLGGIVVGLLLSAPLWAMIGGVFYGVYRLFL